MNSRVGQQLGNYRLKRLIGQGGFAEVYLAEHVHLKTQAAIKLLLSSLNTQDIQAFVQEAQTIASLKHPSILRILDFGFEQTLPFLVMDYAPGGALRDRHPANQSVPLPTILPYIRQAASALAYAHQKKLIHRDVKPENMLVDMDGNILLGDFGIAAVAHSTSSMKTIDNIGTVHYMAPEQIKGKPRPSSDQYALAIVAYEWIAGKLPFMGDTPIEIAMHHLSDPPPSLRANIPSLAPAVEQVLFRALAKDPEQRFPDIQAFVDALEQTGGQKRPHQVTLSSPSQQQPQPLPPTLIAPIQGPSAQTNTREQVYEAFRLKIQSEQAYAVYGDVVVVADDNQKQQVIHLLAEDYWIKQPKSRNSHALSQTVLAKTYTMDGHAFTAGVFKNVAEGEYLVWIDETNPFPILVHAKEAMLADLHSSTSNPLSPPSKIQGPPDPSIHEKLRKTIQSKQIYAVYGDIVVITDNNQAKQVIHLLAEDYWIKQPKKRNSHALSKTILAKTYTMDGHAFIAGVFKNVSEGEYLVWIDETNPFPVQVRARKTILINM